MIVINQLLTLQSLILTLNEKRTITAPYYLFVFENVSTKETVKAVINSASDISSYKTRFNEFEINPAVLFSGKTPGQYNYFVYEQTSNSNLITTGLTLVEMGKMVLQNTTNDFSWT